MKPGRCVTRQRGVALAVGLIFLVILTVVGLAGMRMTTQQTLQAANYQFKTLTFQGSEGGIRNVMAEVRGLIPPPAYVDVNDPLQNILVRAISATVPVDLESVDVPMTNPATDNPLSEPRINQPVVSPRARVGAVVYSDNPDGSGAPLVNYSLGGNVAAYRFTIRSVSRVPNTNARSDHQQGMERIGPRP